MYSQVLVGEACIAHIIACMVHIIVGFTETVGAIMIHFMATVGTIGDITTLITAVSMAVSMAVFIIVGTILAFTLLMDTIIITEMDITVAGMYLTVLADETVIPQIT